MITQVRGTISVHGRTFQLLVSADEIMGHVKRIAGEIKAEYADKQPVLIGILNGSFMFLADLVREMDIPCETTFVKLRSYNGMNSTGKIQEDIGIMTELEGRHVIVVEDIVDSGLTVAELTSAVKARKPASLKLATLVHKPGANKHGVIPDYTGFETGDDFIIGYGMDYDQLGRNLRDIYIEKKNNDA
jgi:hypoxanthine phosphoribosyltransferase